jgi:uncharacterized protein with von Willebrand factor type A (vWA) domain
MFVSFFTELKSARVPVTLREYLTLMQADLGRGGRELRLSLSRIAVLVSLG